MNDELNELLYTENTRKINELLDDLNNTIIENSSLIKDANIEDINLNKKHIKVKDLLTIINNYRELRSKIEEEEKGFYDIEEVEEFEVGENKDNIGQENKIIDNNDINKDKINKKMISEQANPNSDLTSIFKQTSSEMDIEISRII